MKNWRLIASSVYFSLLFPAAIGFLGDRIFIWLGVALGAYVIFLGESILVELKKRPVKSIE